jgi:hypothetical protein
MTPTTDTDPKGTWHPRVRHNVFVVNGMWSKFRAQVMKQLHVACREDVRIMVQRIQRTVANYRRNLVTCISLSPKGVVVRIFGRSK